MAVGSFVCHNITVLDEMIVEDSETFTITVETFNPNDMITEPSTATVTVMDDDSKYKNCFLSTSILAHYYCSSQQSKSYHL